MLTKNIQTIISNGVATIGGKDIIPKYIGTLSWSPTYEEGKLHKNKLNNVLYFPDTPANILSTIALNGSMKDYE